MKTRSPYSNVTEGRGLELDAVVGAGEDGNDLLIFNFRDDSDVFGVTESDEPSSFDAGAGGFASAISTR